MTRSLLGWVLIVGLCLPSMGTLLYLHFQKKAVRKAVKTKLIAEINKEDLVLLKFKKSEIDKNLTWKHDAEFEYLGQMYDVIYTKIKNDSTYYWCWWDHEETSLNKLLREKVALLLAQNPEKNQLADQLDKFYKSLFFYSTSDSFITNDKMASQVFYFVNTRILQRNNIPPSPPPKRA